MKKLVLLVVAAVIVLAVGKALTDKHHDRDIWAEFADEV